MSDPHDPVAHREQVVRRHAYTVFVASVAVGLGLVAFAADSVEGMPGESWSRSPAVASPGASRPS